MSDRIIMPLSVYVLYHKDYTDGLNAYTDIYHLLCRNSERPLTDGIDIPVFLRTGGSGEQIPEIDFQQSQKTAILLLVDERMYCCDLWCKYIGALADKANESITIFPIALFKHMDINSKIDKKQFIKLKTESIKNNWGEFKLRLLDDVVRFITNKGQEKLKLFISHSKKDSDKIGELKAKELRNYIRSDTKLDSFFDANDIVDGYEFDKQIKENVGKSLLIVLKTDSYSEREWCRIEALSGKKNTVPCITVSLINGEVKRNFPYLGNVPLIRFNDNWQDIVNLLLKTALNQYFQEQLLAEIKKHIIPDAQLLPFSPELLSFCLLKGAKKVLYPEPPLGSEEIDFLTLFDDSVSFITPMQAYAELSKNLTGKKIAICVSNSDEIIYYGGGEALLRDITIELSRHILVAGGNLVYGGDLRQQGFTELLKDLSCQYGQYEKTACEVKYFTNYFAWPIHLNLTTTHKADFKHSRVSVVEVKPPDECPEDLKSSFIPPTTVEDSYLWAKSLSKMRVEMESAVDARIILGGVTHGFKGKYAGIIEEFITAKENNHPIYLLGGFGGASKAIIDVIEKQIDVTYLHSEANRDAKYSELETFYNLNSKSDKIDYDLLYTTILNGGISALNNGLSEDDNKILFHSTNVLEIVSLVLKGLNNKFKN